MYLYLKQCDFKPHFRYLLISVQIRQASNASVNTHSHFLQSACWGQRPQAPFEHRISFCGCAFCERFERVRQSAVPFKMPWNKSFHPYFLMAVAKHSYFLYTRGQKAYPSFTFTPHLVPCFKARGHSLMFIWYALK